MLTRLVMSMTWKQPDTYEAEAEQGMDQIVLHNCVYAEPVHALERNVDMDRALRLMVGRTLTLTFDYYLNIGIDIHIDIDVDTHTESAPTADLTLSFQYSTLSDPAALARWLRVGRAGVEPV